MIATGQRVAMFHIGRSGSSVVTSMLSKHRDLHWDGEVYEAKFKAAERELSDVKPAYRFDPVKLLEERLYASKALHYGFEVKFFHLQILDITLRTYISGLKNLGFIFICLRRRNYLRKVVSSLIGHRYGKFHMRSGEIAQLKQIYVDVARIEIDRTSKPLMDFLKGFQYQWHSLSMMLDGERVLNLTYEDDVRDGPEAAYGRVCQFIGIDQIPVQIELAKTNPFPLRCLIVNFHEVEALLRGTAFEWMVYD
jgi:hypothetical protein